MPTASPASGNEAPDTHFLDWVPGGRQAHVTRTGLRRAMRTQAPNLWFRGGARESRGNPGTHPLSPGPRIHSFAARSFGAKPRPLVKSNTQKASARRSANGGCLTSTFSALVPIAAEAESGLAGVQWGVGAAARLTGVISAVRTSAPWTPLPAGSLRTIPVDREKKRPERSVKRRCVVHRNTPGWLVSSRRTPLAELDQVIRLCERVLFAGYRELAQAAPQFTSIRLLTHMRHAHNRAES